MTNSILDRFSFRESRRRYLNLKGIMSRRYAFKSPDVVQVDLTDMCTGGCLACWNHSPFKSASEPAERLDFGLVKGLLKGFAGTGTKEIIFSGGGEPFLYPEIWETLDFIEQSGLVCRINTSLFFLEDRDIRRLAAFRSVISLTASIWAGEAGLYSRLHSRPPEMFRKVGENLRLLNQIKSPRLDVKMYSVINNINYGSLREMLAFSRDTGCDGIEFGVTDVIPGVTDSLLLNDGQLNSLKIDFLNITADGDFRRSGIRIKNKDIFLRRISNLKAGSGEYDTYIERTPCYAGWFFLRVRANGDFNSCLKSHRLPIGNAYREEFRSVWNNRLQQTFREKSLSIPKDEVYFRHIGNAGGDGVGCIRICDNVLINEKVRRFLRFFPCR